MTTWVRSFEDRVSLVADQLVAALKLAESLNLDRDAVQRPYLELIRSLYESDFGMARLMDSSDLVTRYESKTTGLSRPRVGLLSSVLSSLRDQLREVIKSVVGLTAATSRVEWPSILDPRLSGLGAGSLVVGVSVGSIDPEDIVQPTLDLDKGLIESVRRTIRTLPVVARYVMDDRIDPELSSQIDDPAIRDTLMVATSRLAPSGRGSIQQVSFIAPGLDDQAPRPLTGRSRMVLRAALDRPVLPSKLSGEFRGRVREIDLDARRFEIRNVDGLGFAIRCVYAPERGDDAGQWLDATVEVTGTYETDNSGRPRLMTAETVRLLEPRVRQAALPLDKDEIE